MSNSGKLRWKLTGDEIPSLFPNEQLQEHHVGTGAYSGIEFMHVDAKKIINEVRGNPSVPFRYTINVYRGCSHACKFCFARPTHRYLDLGIGEDFETKIVVKVNAVERLRAELRSKQWRGDLIAMGTNTDPYQKAEGKYHLTRRIIETLAEARNPFSILTKSTLILRDLDVLVKAAQTTSVSLNMSIGTLDRDVWKLTEPGTPPPDKRVEAVKKLNQAGLKCGVLMAPILPAMSDSEVQISDVVKACVSAGATNIHPIALHLKPGVRDYYMDWLRSVRPDLIPMYERRFRGRTYQPKVEQERINEIVQRCYLASA